MSLKGKSNCRWTEPIVLDELDVLKEGITYVYVDKVTSKKMVVKILDIDEYFTLESMIVEFSKMIRLSYEPEIATTFFLHRCVLDGCEYQCYLQDYLEGKTLKEFLENNKDVKFQDAVLIFESLAKALNKAHYSEIIHHDLHDENVIITNQGYTKVIDFHWYSRCSSEDYERDYAALMDLGEQIYRSIMSKDKKCFRIVLDMLNTEVKAKSLPSDFGEIKEIAFDLSFLRDRDQKLLSYLVRSLENYESEIKDFAYGCSFFQYRIPGFLVDHNAKKRAVAEFVNPPVNKPRFIDNNEFLNMRLDSRLKRYSMIFDRLNLFDISVSEIELKKNSSEDETLDYYTTFFFRPTLKCLQWMRYSPFISFLEAENDYEAVNFGYDFNEWLEDNS